MTSPRGPPLALPSKGGGVLKKLGNCAAVEGSELGAREGSCDPPNGGFRAAW